MDRQQYVDNRVKRYMAQTLEEFERVIEPLVPQEASKEFKAVVRRKITALGADCKELMDLEQQAINGHAQDMRDRISPDGARTRS